jgi:hypothetical protein
LGETTPELSISRNRNLEIDPTIFLTKQHISAPPGLAKDKVNMATNIDELRTLAQALLDDTLSGSAKTSAIRKISKYMLDAIRGGK